MQMPPSTLKGKKKDGEKGLKFGKLIQNDKGNFLYRSVNYGYNFFMIIKDFTFKLLWGSSCFAFLFVFPCAFEMFNEQ